MTRARDTADTQDNLGGAVAPFVAGKNRIINGDFFWNQRGFTSATTTGVYTFDRWVTEIDGLGTATYTTQPFTPGAAPVAGYESANFLQIVTSGQSTTTNYVLIDQRVEDVRTFANQTVTLSFWAKATSGTPKVGTSFIQNFGSGGSALVIVKSGDVTISTNWARYSVTIPIPSITGKTIGTSSNLRTILWTSAGSGLSSFTDIGIQNTTIQLWGVQLEAANVMTPFTTASGSIGGELALCQRYLPAVRGLNIYSGYAYASTNAIFSIPLPVPARVAPTGITPSGTFLAFAANVSSAATPSFDTGGVNACSLLMALSITIGQGSRFQTSADSLLLFTGCEL